MQKGFSAIVILLLGLLILSAASGGGYYFYNQQKLKSITDYESCAKHYPVLLSHPGQCNTPDGRHFVQQLSEVKKVVSPTSVPSKFIKNEVIDEPLLYPKVVWGATESATLIFHNEEGIVEIKGFRNTANLPQGYSRDLQSDFFAYYDQELLLRGWSIDDWEWADGADGGIRGYRKGNKRFRFGYNGSWKDEIKKGSQYTIEYSN